MGLITKDRVIAGGLGLYSEVIFAPPDPEISFHTPLGAVRVSYFPIFCACFLVDSPADNDDRVVQVHPGNAVVLEVTIGQLLLLLLFFLGPNHQLSFFVVGSHSAVLQIRAHFRLVVIRQDSLLVEGEHSWHVQFSVNNSVSQDLLHHFLLRRLSVRASDEVTLLDLRDLRALRILAACLSFRFSQVWGAFFRD